MPYCIYAKKIPKDIKTWLAAVKLKMIIITLKFACEEWPMESALHWMSAAAAVRHVNAHDKSKKKNSNIFVVVFL